MPLIENPELYPVWVVQFSPSEEAEALRGKQVFEMMQEFGFRVDILNHPAPVVIRQPWTYLFCPVPIVDFTEHRKALDTQPCSVIMDCHFPIMALEHAFTPEPDGMFELIESREVMINNLSLADAVTVPHEKWAADLAEVNPHVFLLPDVDNDSEDSYAKFMARVNEIAVMSHRTRKARKCTCDECNTPDIQA